MKKSDVGNRCSVSAGDGNIINSRISLAVSKLLPVPLHSRGCVQSSKMAKLVNKREGASSLDVKEESVAYRFDVTPVDDGEVGDAVNSVQKIKGVNQGDDMQLLDNELQRQRGK